MENENNLIDNQGTQDFFKFEFKEQNSNNNVNFKRWKNLMLKKFGNNAKLFKCPRDEIVFYSSDYDCKNVHIYIAKCPICNYFVCYYCQYFLEDGKYESARCCVKRRIQYMFHRHIYTFIHPKIDYRDENFYHETFNSLFKLYFIPLSTFLYFVSTIHAAFYYKMQSKKINHQYEYRIKDSNYFLIIFILDALQSIVLGFSYLILDYYFKIVLFIISIPWKLIPIKAFIGFCYSAGA